MSPPSLRPARVSAPPAKPLLVFDGDCNFCRRSIGRCREITGELVDYVPFQDQRIAEQFPELPRARFEKAVQLIETDGRVFGGAEALFRALAVARRWPLWIYQHVPAAAPLAEWGYRLVAEHRVFFSWITRILWGESFERPKQRLVRWLFLRALGVIYLVAFVSLWTQITGLAGRQGITPAANEMRVLKRAADEQNLGIERYHLEPTLCWWRADDRFLHWQCGAGAILSLFVIAGVAPAPCLFLLWAIYLSLSTICGIFLGYQWDALLLETGLLAIFFAPWRLWPRPQSEAPPSPVVLWLLRWLLFRLMFASACVKLLSGDATWRGFTALNFHYETQPLPTWIAWYAHQLPEWFQKLSVGLMFVTELIVPFLIFVPRGLRLAAFWPLVVLQLLIAATGNYTFFNLLAITLCLLLLDDRALLRFVPSRWRERTAIRFAPPLRELPRILVLHRVGTGIAAAVIVLLSSMLLLGMLHARLPWPSPLIRLYQWTAPFRSLNNYGLFAVMTTSRPEIIVEGSQDGQTWHAYEFKYKPGDLKRRPRFVAPHQPRLDWQMWFAALGDVRQNPWFVQFCERLLQGSPDVLGLLERNPFPETPPKYVRAQLYDYHFTTFAERRAEGAWWRREFKGEYCPALALRQPADPPR